MNTTRIEWVKNQDGSQGYTFNPITGCLGPDEKGPCSYCYARKLANGRLKERYLANKNIAPLPEGSYTNYGSHVLTYLDPQNDPFYPRFWPERLDIKRKYEYGDCRNRIRCRGIFVCDMSDLFGIGIPREWQYKIFQQIRENPHDRFYLLTKCPDNLLKFSPFPLNCWVGATVTDLNSMVKACVSLRLVEAKVKFISYEPLLGDIDDALWPEPSKATKNTFTPDWVIIGAITGTKKEVFDAHHFGGYSNLTPMPLTISPHSNSKWSLQPDIEWVEKIVRACNEAGVKVFLKDNVWPLFNGYRYAIPLWAFDKESRLRQEMPIA